MVEIGRQLQKATLSHWKAMKLPDGERQFPPKNIAFNYISTKNYIKHKIIRQ